MVCVIFVQILYLCRTVLPCRPAAGRQTDSLLGKLEISKAGDTTCGVPLKEGLLLQHVSGPQEGWGTKTCYQPQGSKQLCSSRALPDGGNSHFEGPPGAGRLAGKDQPERCMLCNSDTPITSEVPAVPISREKLSLHLSPLQPMLCPMGIHKNP